MDVSIGILFITGNIIIQRSGKDHIIDDEEIPTPCRIICADVDVLRIDYGIQMKGIMSFLEMRAVVDDHTSASIHETSALDAIGFVGHSCGFETKTARLILGESPG